ncbi:hypothetical protein CEXT_276901 [Caerostris extrusa]|uniref:Endonuclease/exonuclease/phosphatase domain-containing protein n=1 Tax=Caerostris extrusa TaxID=172846 RepID=A0AAV4WMX5_CAEEX|nr:hypothetical protein CEXT_276901 [Caerostris extrusa]
MQFSIDFFIVTLLEELCLWLRQPKFIFIVRYNNGTDSDKSEVVHLDVWKSGAHFKILAIYSPPSNQPIFSYVNHLKHSIFIGDYNAHSPPWGYSDPNEAGRRVHDFLCSTTFELIYDKKIPTPICITMVEAQPQIC